MRPADHFQRSAAEFGVSESDRETSRRSSSLTRALETRGKESILCCIATTLTSICKAIKQKMKFLLLVLARHAGFLKDEVGNIENCSLKT
jgi:hypothetical protein